MEIEIEIKAEMEMEIEAEIETEIETEPKTEMKTETDIETPDWRLELPDPCTMPELEDGPLQNPQDARTWSTEMCFGMGPVLWEPNYR